mgnify:CR=1 FL=1
MAIINFRRFSVTLQKEWRVRCIPAQCGCYIYDLGPLLVEFIPKGGMCDV